MKQFVAVCYPSQGLEQYTGHPLFTMENLLSVALSVVRESKSEMDLMSKWFDVWDTIMSWLALMNTLEEAVPDTPQVIGAFHGTIRGTVLDHADAVTDLANYAIECAEENYHRWKSIVDYYPLETAFTVIDISPSGILIEVNHGQQAA